MQRPDPLADALAETRTTLTKGDRAAIPYRPGILYASPTAKKHPWWYTFACARIKRICEGAKPSFGAFSRNAALESACSSACHPRLARRYLETYGYFVTRSRPAPPLGIDHNPFRGLSDNDAYARWYTEIERICEASTGKLGGWRMAVSG